MNEIFETITITRMTAKAKNAWNHFKLDVAKELNIPYYFGYNGHLTPTQAGKLGGEITRRCVLEGKFNIIKRYMEKLENA